MFSVDQKVIDNLNDKLGKASKLNDHLKKFISDLENKIIELKEEEKICVEFIRDNNSWKERAYRKHMCRDLNNQINKLEAGKVKALEAANKRRVIKDKPLKVHTFESVRADKKINELMGKINELNDIKTKIDESNKWIADINKELGNAIEKKISLESEMKYNLNLISAIKYCIIEEKWKPKYQEYATKNNLAYDEDDCDHLFSICNYHHNMKISRSYIIYPGCYKIGKNCCPYTLRDSVSIGCSCGNEGVELIEPSSDLRKFNLNTEEPELEYW